MDGSCDIFTICPLPSLPFNPRALFFARITNHQLLNNGHM